MELYQIQNLSEDYGRYQSKAVTGFSTKVKINAESKYYPWEDKGK